MDNQEATAGSRLAYWKVLIAEHNASGESIKAYCRKKRIHERTYYYWQRKLREAKNERNPKTDSNANNLLEIEMPQLKPGGSPTPTGWTRCVTADEHIDKMLRKTVHIKIGKCTLKAASGTDMETLAQVCRVLVSLC
jgi:hypothetical protein